MTNIDAATLAPLINNYSVGRDPYTVIIPSASQLRDLVLQEITVTGNLINRQLTSIDIGSGNRSWRTPAGGGLYDHLELDGDIHFALGTVNLQPHIPCEIQSGDQATLDSLSNSIGRPISVTGFFRCLFEHPGYWGKADAHIFEIHPVGNLSFDGNNFGFPVGRPDPQAIHQWDAKITNQDATVQVTYDVPSDTLQFSNTGKMDENYVQAAGQVSNIQINNDPAGLSSFQFTSQDIGYTIAVLCLPNTNAFAQISNLNNGDNITLLGLRNIDLDQAIKNQQYVINILAVDISK